MITFYLQKLFFVYLFLLNLDPKPRSKLYVEGFSCDRIKCPSSFKSDSLPLTRPIKAAKSKQLSVSNTTFANAALYSYDFSNLPQKYSQCHIQEVDGFKAVTLCNYEEKIAIISFRGTRTIEDLNFDLALILGNEVWIKALIKVYTDIGKFIDKFLVIFTGFGDKVVSRFHDDHIDKKLIQESHHNFRYELKKKWRDFKVKKLNVRSLAGLLFGQRMELVKKYVELELERYQRTNFRIYVVGHSLGGLYAQLASLMFNLPGASFNSPGISRVLQSCGILNVNDEKDGSMHFLNHIQKSDLVSKFEQGNHHGEVAEYEKFYINPFMAHSLNNIFIHL